MALDNKQHASELFDATTRMEHAALRPLYLLNGGAMLATMTFAGHVREVAPSVLGPMFLWIAGLVLAFITTVLAYRHQDSAYRAHNVRSESKDARHDDREGARHGNVGETIKDRATWLRQCAYVSGSLSVACFAAGAIWAVMALACIEQSTGGG